MEALVVTDPHGVKHVFGPYDNADDAIKDSLILQKLGTHEDNGYRVDLASFADPSEIINMMRRMATVI